MPPVDITFGDFLRAILTADLDLHPSDDDGVRDALMQGFRLRGIVADGAEFFSEDSLRWPKVADVLPPVTGLLFGDPNGLTGHEKDVNGNILRGYAKANATLLGFAERAGSISAPSFHPMFHMAEDGSLYVNMVVELVQTVWLPFDADPKNAFPMRNGVTLLVAQDPTKFNERPAPRVLFVIQKLHTKQREERIRTYFQSTGRSLGEGDARFQIDFGLLHVGA